jgi:glycosyltransferase involved in cell wall biosynthesis
LATPKVKNKIKVSVLIPVFNQSVHSLVQDIIFQCESIQEDWEIILLEDGSDPVNAHSNSFLANHPRVSWVERKVNKGRATTRNELAQMATGNYLLFLDADSQIIDPLFIKNYIRHLPSYSVICGGRIYPSQPPSEIELLLHWNYGIQRESKSVEFMSNNFMIPHAVMMAHPFDSTIQHYGHEDTLFGQMLHWKGWEFTHIDNPVLHFELQTADEFLQKSKQAVQNLWLIKNKYPEFNHPIINISQKTLQLGLSNLIRGIIKTLEGKIRKNLTQSSSPQLLGLDLLKWKWSLEYLASSTPL